MSLPNSKTFLEKENEQEFTLPGQYVFEGIVYGIKQPLEAILSLNDIDISKDDILLASYPRSGSSLMINLIHLILSNSEQDGKNKIYKPFKGRDLFDVAYNLEIEISEKPNKVLIEENKSPRIIKTHLNPKYLEQMVKDKKLKIVWCTRNVKDTLYSFYNFYKATDLHGPYRDSWDKWYSDIYKKDKVLFGDWFDYTKNWINFSRNEIDKDMFCTSFEELLSNMPKVIKQMSTFFKISLKDDIIENICKDCNFHVMKKQFDGVHGMGIVDYFKSGKIGNWKNHLSDQQSKELDERMELEIPK